MTRRARRCAVPVGLIAAAVLAPVPAHAAPPEKFSDVLASTDEDLCGTGETVTITFSVKGVRFPSPRNADVAETYRVRQTFTFGDTTVVGQAAGRFTSALVSVGAQGQKTFAYTSKGLPESFRLQGGGGLLTRDAGSITIFRTFDAAGALVDETFTASGPHPAAASGFALFCEVVPAALGI